MELIDKLGAIRKIMQNSHISALSLCSLSQSHDTLITALESSNEEQLTSSYIKSKLIDEFNRRHVNAENTENTITVFKANRKYSNKANNKCFPISRMRNHNT